MLNDSDIYKFIYFDQELQLKGLSQINTMGYAKIKNPGFFIQCGQRYDSENQTIWQYTLSGSVIIEDQSGCYEVPKGSSFITNSHDETVSYYSSRGAKEPYECVWLTSIGTSEDLCDDLVAKYGRVFSFNSIPKSFSWVKNKMRFAKLIQEESLSQYDAIYQQQLLVKEFLLSTGKNRSRRSPYYQLARNEIINHIDLPFNVRGLAKALGVTPVHLARLFAKEGLSSPRLFINEIKVDHAISLLLNTKMSIKEIALNLGYDTSSHFARTFLKITGKTPLAYRNDRL